ncbi:hypothetical protein O185_07570 [Photorhabdus temperata J3]|uniref:Uncharacterized protein n=1 Tax=Photorhabdus temperata J3 TaxID=1389415 RepID=U7R4I9_PHOTE|nr:hypothetical protein O185_07570 [Photorhabdus temperata J3]
MIHHKPCVGGYLKTAVVLANKLVRIIWRILTDCIDFNIKKAFPV